MKLEHNRAPIRSIAISADVVGEIRLLGRFGGAYCSHYRVDRIEDGYAWYVPVIGQSVRNDDGTFSTRWTDERADGGAA